MVSVGAVSVERFWTVKTFILKTTITKYKEIETCGHVGTDEFSSAKVLFLVSDVIGPSFLTV